jgi:hypothetical protein
VLGVEEIGRVLLKEWDEEKPLAKPKERPSAHVRKQTAVASLLLGALMLRMFPKGVDRQTLDLAGVTEAFNESDEGRLLALIRNNTLYKRKQNALYQDDDLITAIEEDFAEIHVSGIFRIASDAQAALVDHVVRGNARAFHETTLIGE